MSSNKFPTENFSGSSSGSDLGSSLSHNPIVGESNQTYLSQQRLADNPIARELNRRYLCELLLHQSHEPFERERYLRKHTQLVLDVILLGMVPWATDLFAFSLAELFEEILSEAEKEKFQKYMVELAVKCSKDVFILSSGEDCSICLQELEEMWREVWDVIIHTIPIVSWNGPKRNLIALVAGVQSPVKKEREPIRPKTADVV